jgi:hypothetical protein
MDKAKMTVNQCTEPTIKIPYDTLHVACQSMEVLEERLISEAISSTDYVTKELLKLQLESLRKHIERFQQFQLDLCNGNF